MFESPYLIFLLGLLWFFFLLLSPFLIIILIILSVIKIKRYKISLKELIFYFFFYSFLPLIMPFLFFIFLFPLLTPLMELFDIVKKFSLLVFPICILTALFFYFKITLRVIKKFEKIKVGLFISVFTPSLVINFLLDYLLCSMSFLIPCDFRESLTVSGVLKTFGFYITCLVAFILAIQYSNYSQKNPPKLLKLMRTYTGIGIRETS